MIKGIFHSFLHSHYFKKEGTQTVMTDVFDYRSPLGPIGRAADKLLLEKYMKNFLSVRALGLKRLAEEMSADS
ncbi:hypothetical protein [Jeotgalibacillus sp. ET6]|uniref:hypothetical protein n=1 Tax=Jeotgalibacillus sp. ET6 TaxID=3037260 RepID=UPI0030143F5B